MREVRVWLDTGKVSRILANDFDASAQEIADLYKRRWAIELFFRWVEQTLKIRCFLGTSENAARIQIAVALIAVLLLRPAQAARKAVTSPLAFARLVRLNLMRRRPLDRLLERETRPVSNGAAMPHLNRTAVGQARPRGEGKPIAAPYCRSRIFGKRSPALSKAMGA